MSSEEDGQPLLDMLSTLPGIKHLDISVAPGGTLAPNLPLLARLTCLEAGWYQLGQRSEDVPAVLARCTALERLCVQNGYENQWSVASYPPPTGQQLAAALRALAALPELSQLQLAMDYVAPPGEEEAQAALELLAARPGLAFTNLPFYHSKGEGQESEEVEDGAAGDGAP